MAHNVPALPNVPPGVHILGQPCEIKAAAGPQVAVLCNCESRTLLLLNGIGIPVMCPACRRGRMVKTFNGDAVTRQVNIEVADVSIEEKQ